LCTERTIEVNKFIKKVQKKFLTPHHNSPEKSMTSNANGCNLLLS
jgi:hypothetical protein